MQLASATAFTQVAASNQGIGHISISLRHATGSTGYTLLQPILRPKVLCTTMRAGWICRDIDLYLQDSRWLGPGQI